MRRTKSDTLHPANRVIAASLSQYQPGDGKAIVYQPGGPHDSLWHNLPVLPITESWCIVKKYNFYRPADVDLTTLWDQMKDEHGATAPSFVEQQGGGMRFESGSSPGVSYNYIVDQYPIFQFIEGKTTWAEFNITHRDTGVAEGGFQALVIGFGDELSDTYGSFMSPVVPKNGIVLDNFDGQIAYVKTFKDDMGVDDNVEVNGVESVEIDLSDNQPHKIGIRIEPNEADASKFDVYVFQNDEYVGASKEVAIPTDINMGIVVGTYSHEDEITINQIIVIQEKDVD